LPFVLACFQASAAPRLVNPDSEEDALFGLDSMISSKKEQHDNFYLLHFRSGTFLYKKHMKSKLCLLNFRNIFLIVTELIPDYWTVLNICFIEIGKGKGEARRFRFNIEFSKIKKHIHLLQNL
jgi:hypothetical protein